MVLDISSKISFRDGVACRMNMVDWWSKRSVAVGELTLLLFEFSAGGRVIASPSDLLLFGTLSDFWGVWRHPFDIIPSCCMSVAVGLSDGVLACHWPGQTFSSVKDDCLSLVGFKDDGWSIVRFKDGGRSGLTGKRW